jgi:F-type H+-transporting ATPase subunit delta
MRGIIAQRYAKALFALAKTGPIQEEWERQLKQLAALLKTEEGLRKMLLHPTIDVSKKQEVLQQLTVQLDAAEPVKRVLNLLIQRNRLQTFPVMVEAFSQLVDRAQGRQPILVQTAYPLSDHDAKSLQDQMERIFKKRIEFEREVNPDLIGGVVFQLGSLRYDGSIRGRLTRLRTAATEGV